MPQPSFDDTVIESSSIGRAAAESDSTIASLSLLGNVHRAAAESVGLPQEPSAEKVLPKSRLGRKGPGGTGGLNSLREQEEDDDTLLKLTELVFDRAAAELVGLPQVLETSAEEVLSKSRLGRKGPAGTGGLISLREQEEDDDTLLKLTESVFDRAAAELVGLPQVLETSAEKGREGPAGTGGLISLREQEEDDDTLLKLTESVFDRQGCSPAAHSLQGVSGQEAVSLSFNVTHSYGGKMREEEIVKTVL